jgi:hypothetical protein
VTTRTITGTIYRADSTTWEGAPVSFTMEAGTFTIGPDITYPQDGATVVTDEDGEFSVALTSGLDVYWRVWLPDGDGFRFALPAGSAITLEALRSSAGGLPVPLTSGSDVLITDAEAGQIFAHNGTQFVNREDEILNVKDLGAVGDGATDDVDILQDAVDTMHTRGGGIVYVPAGDYRMSTGITLKANVWLRGAGRGVTILRLLDDADSSVVAFEQDTNNMAITDLTIDGNRWEQIDGVHGIRMHGNGYARIERVEIKEFRHYGIGVGYTLSTQVPISHCLIQNVEIHDGGHDSQGDGVDAKRTEYCTFNHIYVHDIEGNGLDIRGNFTRSTNIYVADVGGTGFSQRMSAYDPPDSGTLQSGTVSTTSGSTTITGTGTTFLTQIKPGDIVRVVDLNPTDDTEYADLIVKRVVSNTSFISTIAAPSTEASSTWYKEALRPIRHLYAENITCERCAGHGFWQEGTWSTIDGINTIWWTDDWFGRAFLVNATARNCGGRGFYLAGEKIYGHLVNCLAEDGASHGFQLNVNDHDTARYRLVNCTARGNVLAGFTSVAQSSTAHVFEACQADNNGTAGFALAGQRHSLIAPVGSGNTSEAVLISGDDCVIQGGALESTGAQEAVELSGSRNVINGTVLVTTTATGLRIGSASVETRISKVNFKGVGGTKVVDLGVHTRYHDNIGYTSPYESWMPQALGDSLLVELDPDEIKGVAHGGAITTFVDGTGNGHDATQATALAKPTLDVDELNGHNVVQFNGTTQYMTGSLTLAQPFTVIAVARIDNNNSRIWAGGASTPAILSGSSGSEMFINGGGLSFAIGEAESRYDIYQAFFNGASSTAEFNGTATSGDAYINGVGGTYAIGGGTGGASLALMGLAYLAIVNRALTAAEKEAYTGWLAERFGMASRLDPDHARHSLGLPEVYNIRDFGAVIDGTTNDLPAWEAAIDTATAAGGGTIYHPGGVSYISDQIAMNGAEHLTFRGEGMSISEIKGSGGVSDYVMTFEDSKHITVCDLHLSNQTTGNTPLRFHSSDSGDPDLMKHIRVQRVWISDHASQGILFQVSATDVEVSDCLVEDGLRGIRFSGYINYSRIIGNYVLNTEESGINCGGSTFLTVMGNTIDNDVALDHGYAGIRLTNGGSHKAIVGNTVSRYGRGIGYYALPEGGEVTSPDGADITISGNTIYETYNTGILIERSNVACIGNTIRNVQDEEGILLSGLDPVEYCTVMGNVILDESGTNMTYGIRESSSCDHNVIFGNTILGAVTEDVHIEGDSTQGPGDVTDDADITKILSFNVSGVTTGTRRTVTAPTSDGTMHASTSGTAIQSMGTKTIASGVVTLNALDSGTAIIRMIVDTEAAAASDDLDSITATGTPADGTLLLVKTASSARDVTLKNNTGGATNPMRLQGGRDAILGDSTDRVLFAWLTNRWDEVSRSLKTATGAYTQTYSTADRTHANPTAVAVTNAFGTANATMEDATGAHDQTILNNNFKELTTQTNALIADVADLKQLVNSIIDDLQTLGLVS